MNAHTEIKADAVIKSLTVDIGDLRAALAWVNSVRQHRNTIPIISHNLFRVENGILSITATDLDRETTETLLCEASENWGFVANGYRILKVTAGLTGSVKIEHDVPNERLTLTAEGITLVMNLLAPAEDWPALVKHKHLGSIEVGEAVLHQALKLVKPCISTEETRYYLNGIFWAAHDGALRMVTTDGHRLARLDLDAPEPPHNVIFPRDAVSPLLAMLTAKGNQSAKISFYGKDNTARVMCAQVGERTLYAKLIDGTYPDYTRVIPSDERENKIDILVPRTAAQRLRLMTDGDRWANKVCRISPEKGTMTVAPSGGDETLSVTYAAAGKPAPEVGFNVNYLAQATATLGDIRLRSSSGADPALVTCEAHTNLLMVLMPMRV
ncbi:DNA polymerase III subunit beta [Tritonibacter mobilis]|uniref:DNA polymerase III subunit beta n=1 Tax=Tritonibacter mobilis TaxID=379347 RepID=UPI000806EF9A|nr:DNA polymerase III subunit beta [Tritonibacter mobilis]GLP86267.1 DNA polymerase III subunit beta [Tritonibacter mobilis]SDX17461.1 DNA polymerase-3 subunit beta [Tritonibacter mobilis]